MLETIETPSRCSTHKTHISTCLHSRILIRLKLKLPIFNISPRCFLYTHQPRYVSMRTRERVYVSRDHDRFRTQSKLNVSLHLALRAGDTVFPPRSSAGGRKEGRKAVPTHKGILLRPSISATSLPHPTPWEMHLNIRSLFRRERAPTRTRACIQA